MQAKNLPFINRFWYIKYDKSLNLFGSKHYIKEE